MAEEQNKNAYYDELLEYDIRVGNHMVIAEDIAKVIREATALMDGMNPESYAYSCMQDLLRYLGYAARENRSACFSSN